MNIQEMGDQIKVTIPKNREDTIPLTFTVNGESVTVPRGEEVTIPAMFAGVIKNWWKSQFYEEAEDVSKPSEENSSDKKRHLLFENEWLDTNNTSVSLYEKVSPEKLAEFGITGIEEGYYNKLFEKHRMIIYLTDNGVRNKLVLECLDPENLYDPTKGVGATCSLMQNGKPVIGRIYYQAGYDTINVIGDYIGVSVKLDCYLEEL